MAATPTDAPTAPSIAGLLDGVEEDDAPGAAPVTDDSQAPPETTPEAPADAVADQEDTLEEEPEALGAPSAPAEPVAWQPPPGGEPFAFRADGREVPVPGAVRYPQGVYVPAESWSHVQRHLADREAFSAQLRTRDQQIAQLNPEQHPQVIEARATIQKFQDLLNQGPEAVAKWLDDFSINRPLIEQQIQNAALKAQLEARTGQVTDAEMERGAAQLATQLPGYLRQNIEAAIASDPELKDLTGEPVDQLLEKLWPIREQLFIEVDRDYPEAGLRKGQVIVHPTVLKYQLGQYADARRQIKRLEAAAKQNRAATSRIPAAPTVPTRGRPVPGGRPKTAYASKQEFEDDLLRGDDE